MEDNENKITLEEYQRKYSEKSSVTSSRAILIVVASSLGIIVFTCLLLTVLRVFEFNFYAGIVSSIAAIIIFVFLYIVPLVKVSKLEQFRVKVNRKNVNESKRHNKKMRLSLAQKIIDLHEEVSDCSWYGESYVEALKGFMIMKDEEGIKTTLTSLYTGPIKKAANDLIFKAAMKCGTLTALSQDEKVDSAIVVAVNLKLIKDIVYLYGFRPSDSKMLSIFKTVLMDTLVAYGVGNVKIGSAIAGATSALTKDIPVIGSLVSFLAPIIDSGVNGLTNGIMSATLGYKTVSFLETEYKLQNILDGVDIMDVEEELSGTSARLKKELSSFNSTAAKK